MRVAQLAETDGMQPLITAREQQVDMWAEVQDDRRRD